LREQAAERFCYEASFPESRLRREGKESNSGLRDLFTNRAANKDPGFFASLLMTQKSE